MGLFDFFKKKNVNDNTISDRSNDYENAYSRNDVTTIELLILESIGIKFPTKTLTPNHEFNGIIINDYLKSMNLSGEVKQYLHSSYYNIANEMQRRHNDKLAIELFMRALMCIEQASALNNMATSYKKIGNVQKAIDTYKWIFKSFPNYTNGYLRFIKVGLAYDKISFDDAKDAMNKYFSYGGTKENIQYFTSDPAADVKEKQALSDFYLKY